MKKLFTLLSVLFLGFALAACNKDKGDQELFDYDIITKLPEGETVEITFWHSLGTDKAALVQAYIDQFTAEYPNVSVSFTKEGNNYDELRDKVTNSIVTGTTPTLVMTYPDHVASYLQGEGVLALDPFINDKTVGLSEEELEDFIPAYLEENKQTGHYMGLPFNKSTEVLIYNKTYFESKKGQAGFEDLTALYNVLKENGISTWAQIEAASEEIVAAESTTSQKKWGFAYDSVANLFITLIRQHGGQYTNSDGDILFNTSANRAKTVEALNFYKQLHEDGLATLPIEWEEDYASTPFTNELVYMTVGSTAGVGYNVAKNADGTAKWEIGVAPIPQKDLNNKAVIQQGTNVSLMANSTDAERLAGWLLIKHLASKDVTIDWAMNTGYLPVRQSAYDDPTYGEFLTDPETDLIYTSMAANAARVQSDYMFYDPAFPNSSSVRATGETTMQAVLFNKTKTIEQLLQDAENELSW